MALGANKNAEVYRKIAEAWLVTDNKDADEASKLANMAVKTEPKKCGELYITWRCSTGEEPYRRKCAGKKLPDGYEA